MKKLILTFALILSTGLQVLLFTFNLASANWLVVPKIGFGTGRPTSKTSGAYRADLSPLPIPVVKWSGTPLDPSDCPPILNPSCFLISVLEDFSSFTVGKKDLWYKPSTKEVQNWLKHKNIDYATYPPLPAGGQSFLWRLWEWIQPTLAWATSCAPCDDFTRANSSPISGSWNYGNVYATTDYPQIVSNAVSIVSGLGIAYYTAFSWANNQESQITLTNFNDPSPGSFSSLAGPTVRMDGNMNFDTANFYGVLCAASTSYVEIDSYHPYPTSITTLASASVTCTAGDLIKLRIVGETLTLYQNGASILTASGDGTILSGHPGMWLIDNTGDTLGANLLVDNFTAADVGGAAVVRHRVLNQ